jgi:hypothetical protein
MDAMPLKMSQMPYYLTPQPFRNGGRSNFWDGRNIWSSERASKTFFCMLIDFQRMNNFQESLCDKDTDVKGGLKLKFIFCFEKMKFGIVKYHGHTYKFYLNYYFILWRF